MQFFFREPSHYYESVSPKLGHQYWQNGEYQFPDDSPNVRYINIKSDDDFIYSLVFLSAEKSVIFELHSTTTGGKWKTFEI